MQDDYFSYENGYQHGSCVKLITNKIKYKMFKNLN